MAWMHPQVLLPANVGWVLRGSDWGQSSLGLNAYLRASDWPATTTPLILYPQHAHLLLMDSNPLLGLLLAPFASLLPAEFQMIGIWLLLCLLLHVGFAYALVRRHAPDFLSVWLGTALLTLLPTLFDRYGHATLCAHWLILWALWIFTDPRRARASWHWAAVIAVAGLVHSYLLLMVAALWASALLQAAISMPRPAIWLRLAGQAAAILLLVAGLALLHGAAGTNLVSTDTYGNFTMALDALWNPGNPSFSKLLPSSSNGHGAAFEGFQYLGAGLLALILVAIGVALRVPANDGQRRLFRQLLWLLPAFLVLTLLAIGTNLRVGGATIASVELPQELRALLDPVRASGRLFWPAAYTIVLAAIVTVYRLRRPVAVMLLGGALMLQIIDITPMFAAIREETATATRPGTFTRTRDPRWDLLIGQASAVEIEPPQPDRDLQLLEEIGWRAVRRCRPMRYTYMARTPANAQARIDADRRAFVSGQLDPTRLYVLYAPTDAPIGLRARVTLLDGIAVIAPTRPAGPLPGCHMRDSRAISASR